MPEINRDTVLPLLRAKEDAARETLYKSNPLFARLQSKDRIVPNTPNTPWRRFGQKIGIFNKPNLREFKDIMLLHPDLPFLIHRKKIGWDDGSYRERFYANREIANA